MFAGVVGLTIDIEKVSDRLLGSASYESVVTETDPNGSSVGAQLHCARLCIVSRATIALQMAVNIHHHTCVDIDVLVRHEVVQPLLPVRIKEPIRAKALHDDECADLTLWERGRQRIQCFSRRVPVGLFRTGHGMRGPTSCCCGTRHTSYVGHTCVSQVSDFSSFPC